MQTVPPREIELYYHTVADFAVLVGFTERAIRRMCDRKAIRSVLYGGDWRIKPGELDRLRGYRR